MIFAGVETGLIFAIQPAYSRGLEWPVLLIGIVAFVTLISGYLPIPFELLKRRARDDGIGTCLLDERLLRLAPTFHLHLVRFCLLDHRLLRRFLLAPRTGGAERI
jgi:hypothetical protein